MIKNVAATGLCVALVSATDGSAMTTGTPAGYVTLDGGSQAGMSGSVTHEGNGQWSFNLTQAEMNADVVGVVITLAGAVPVNLTIATEPANRAADVIAISGDSTAANNAESFFDGTGYAGTNNVIPTVTTLTNKSGFSLTSGTGLGNQTANITGNLSGSVGSVTTKTGYSLAATTGLGNQTANITGNLSGSVGSVTGAVGSVTGAVGSVTGAVGSVTSYGTLVADVAAAVWAIATSTLTSAGTIGKYILDHIIGIVATGTHTAQTGDAYATAQTILEDTADLQANQAAWATATGFAVAGDAMTLTAAYDAAKTAAQAGDEMDLVDAPNATAITAIQSGLALGSDLTIVGGQVDTVQFAVDALPDASAIQTAAGAALTSYDPPTKGELDSAVSGLALEATLSAIKGATWTDETLEAIKTVVDGLEAGTAPTVEEIAAAVAAALAAAHGSGAWGGATGTGGTSFQWPEDGDPVVDEDGLALDGVAVWITSDEAGDTVVAGPQYTLATGYVAEDWLLDDGGTYYGWIQLSRYNATVNPTEFTVS